MAYTKACEGGFVTVDSDLGGRNRERFLEIYFQFDFVLLINWVFQHGVA